ncbi:hypothetical protein BCR32DRAFT_286584 [Anaeromyces robustus]|uniref:Uncharacterized protein n=1 Tax=Anaeromyces robustus TaxID=1754192 RepID=A0A1Y1VVR4_9FUNG|nr:hypothetical protein BCR32DRAFT_286584 [Anaeromyces robustus]|eukprot:ORX65293.1 hypothetical protein BCR32DRAFT_286584 [Anaeromyces robustus]
MFERKLYDRSYFIENNTNPTFFQWMRSKGTNYECYLQKMSEISDTQWDNIVLKKYDSIISAIVAPCSFYFLYWSLLIFILHKFDFRKPVMRIILGHLVIRCMGNVLEVYGETYNTYYFNKKVKDSFGNEYLVCDSYADVNTHPFRWFLTRQIGTICWYLGEIIADWYPLLRTKAIVKQKQMHSVYFTCALFNLSKILLIVYHLSRNPTKFYNPVDGTFNEFKKEKFSAYYWSIQLTIIVTSIIYECSIFFTLKKCVFEITDLNMGIMKKFKVLSEYRILSSAFVAMVCLPFICIAIIIQYYYFFFHKPPILMEVQFETVRQAIANVQYFMIFIDQLLLICSNYDAKLSQYAINSDYSSNTDPYTNNFNNVNNNDFKSGNYMNTLKKGISNNHNYVNLEANPTNNNNNNTTIPAKPFTHFVTDLSMVNKNNINNDSFNRNINHNNYYI